MERDDTRLKPTPAQARMLERIRVHRRAYCPPTWRRKERAMLQRMKAKGLIRWCERQRGFLVDEGYWHPKPKKGVE